MTSLITPTERMQICPSVKKLNKKSKFSTYGSGKVTCSQVNNMEDAIKEESSNDNQMKEPQPSINFLSNSHVRTRNQFKHLMAQ
jgi:hypothetical protein